MITGLADISPLLMLLVRSFYLWLGGSSAMDPITSLVVRLLLGAMVLFLPAFLMRGTLPAVITAISSWGDANRGQVALCYGANALGAVAGVGLSTFYLPERFGNRETLWLGCLLNAFIAVSALYLARASTPNETPELAAQSAETVEEPLPQSRGAAGLIYFAAAVTGFGFFLMELVWYRMLGPLLGGSTFTVPTRTTPDKCSKSSSLTFPGMRNNSRFGRTVMSPCGILWRVVLSAICSATATTKRFPLPLSFLTPAGCSLVNQKNFRADSCFNDTSGVTFRISPPPWKYQGAHQTISTATVRNYFVRLHFSDETSFDRKPLHQLRPLLR